MTGQDGQSPSDDEEVAVRRQRVAAYAVVVKDGRVLLTQLSDDTPAPGTWTLPGGGIDHGESPLEAVVREVREETAHDLRDARVLDVGSHRFTARAPVTGRLEDFQSIQVVYTADVEQVREPEVLDVGGSTVQARWVPADELADLPLGAAARRWLARALERPDLLPADDPLKPPG